MRPQPLEAHVRLQSGMQIIDLQGEIDPSSEPILRTAYTETAHKACRIILLNFSGVTYMHKSMLALLVEWLTYAQNAGQQLMICGLSEYYQELFTITRLNDFIPIAPNEAQAWQYARALLAKDDKENQLLTASASR